MAIEVTVCRVCVEDEEPVSHISHSLSTADRSVAQLWPTRDGSKPKAPPAQGPPSRPYRTDAPPPLGMALPPPRSDPQHTASTYSIIVRRKQHFHDSIFSRNCTNGPREHHQGRLRLCLPICSEPRRRDRRADRRTSEGPGKPQLPWRVVVHGSEEGFV